MIPVPRYFQFLGPYGVSKTALLGLVKAMAPQCAQMNIRVNGIAPGIIETNFSSAVSAMPNAFGCLYTLIKF